ncbi:MAG: hypothetical protein LBB86_07180 [Oscillospiraceae bacterium]|nr:hypothetical protein [Oscillospiraceae bacterium]
MLKRSVFRFIACCFTLLALFACASVGMASDDSGSLRRGMVWTDAALLQTYGVESAAFRPSNPQPRDALIILSPESEYRPSSGPASQNPSAALDELGSELYAVAEDLGARLTGRPLSITDDPNQAGLIIELDASYPYAGQYGGYLDAYNCILTITVIDVSTRETIATLSASSEYGESIDVSQFAEGTTVIWKKLPLPSDSPRVEAFGAALLDYTASTELTPSPSPEPTAAPESTAVPQPTDVSQPTEKPAAPTEPTKQGVEGALQYLANDSLNNLYAYLAGGKIIARGASGENAKTFQAMLVDLGAEIKVDGQIGSQTIAAFQSTYQAVLGESAGEALDIQTFGAMIFAMTASRDADAARALFPDASQERIDTLRADRLFQNQEYYSAYKLYTALGAFEDSAARAAACVQPWPSSGALERSSAHRSNLAELKVISEYPEDTSALVKIYAPDGTTAASLFLPGSGETTIGIAPGDYTVRVGSGKLWYGVAEAFGPDGARYSTLAFNSPDKLMHIEQGYTHTLTLLVNELDGNASPVGADGLTWEAFTR